jgi:hypothetical protein
LYEKFQRSVNPSITLQEKSNLLVRQKLNLRVKMFNILPN